MDISKRVQDVFNRFNVNLTVNRTNLAEAALDNGTVIYTDAEAFAEGVEVYIINDEGENIPLPPGDYTLEDGTVLSVGEGGVVTAVTPPAAEEAPAEEAPAAPAELKAQEDEKKKDEEMEDEEEKMEGTAVTREEVAIMIAEAIAALQTEEPEAVAEAVAEEADVVAELKSLKAELSKMNKQAAAQGLARKARAQKVEPIDLSKLSIQERVSALHNKFSK